MCFLIVFLVFTYGFGFFCCLARIARHLGGGDWLGPVVGVCTVALAAISLWIAFAVLINPTAGRAVFAFPGPVFRSRRS